MKRVVIVTWSGVNNYGTALQSFALQYAISKLGFDVCIMDKILELSFLERMQIQFRRFLLSFLISKNSKKYRMYQFHLLFQNIVRPVNKKSLCRLVDDTDVFVSGSDQIWNVSYRYDPMMFLGFAENKKKISYATSIGTPSFPEEYIEIVKKHLQKYSKISVRELTAANYLKNLLGRTDISTVVDPTFLLNPKEWHDFALHSNLHLNLPNKYILCYFVGCNEYYRQQLRDIMKKSGITDVVIVLLNESQPSYIDNAIVVDNANPNDFVKLIEKATLVCTDSFHATALSINLSIPFVDLLRFQDNSSQSQNSRIYDLLNHFGLNNYLFRENCNDWLLSINNVKVQDILKKDRAESFNYLSNSLIS